MGVGGLGSGECGLLAILRRGRERRKDPSFFNIHERHEAEATRGSSGAKNARHGLLNMPSIHSLATSPDPRRACAQRAIRPACRGREREADEHRNEVDKTAIT